MLTLLVFGILTGVDNLQVAAGIGMTPISGRRKWVFALLFGLCEGLMPLIGLLLGSRIPMLMGENAEWVGPVCLAGCGILILVMATRKHEIGPVANSPWLMLVLPLSLSFDNLLAGAGLGAMGYPVALSAMVVGGLSMGLCLAGMALGNLVRHWVPLRADVFSGAWLMVAAIVLVVLD